jgi:hypothetical protein
MYFRHAPRLWALARNYDDIVCFRSFVGHQGRQLYGSDELLRVPAVSERRRGGDPVTNSGGSALVLNVENVHRAKPPFDYS